MKFYWKPRTFHPIDPSIQTALTGLPLASFRRRFAAWMIDLILIICIFGILYKLDFRPFHPEPTDDKETFRVELFHNPWGLALIAAYFGLMTRYVKGRTVGKWIYRIRVASITHDKLTLWQCVERALGYGFSSLEGGFGFIQYYLHPNRQTLHDRIAETVVIWEGKKTKTIKKNKSIPSSETDDDNRE